MIPPSFDSSARPPGLLLACCTLATLTAACDRPAPDEGGAGRPIVAVPVAPLAGLVDAIGPAGAAALDVVVLVPPGANPATHEPAFEELRRAAAARLYLELGHPSFVFERTWLAGLLEGSAAERVPLFDDCPMVEDDYHVWLSASCLETAARRTAAALSGVAPGASEEIGGNLEAFLQRLASTDSTTEARLSPLQGRGFLVLHPAWGYLARPYGLIQMSILSHGTGDPGPARVASLIDRARAERIRLVIVQPQFNQAPARLVAEELEVDVVSLDPLARDPLTGIDEATSTLVRALTSEDVQ